MSRIGDRLDYYQFDNGAIRYCLRKIEEMLEDLDNPALEGQVEEALWLNREAGQLELDWQNQKMTRDQARQGSVATDNEIDKTLSSLYEMIDGHAELSVESRARELARELREELFAGGVFPITSKRFQEQHFYVKDMLTRFDEEFQEHVEVLGLETMLESLAELNGEFGNQLDLLGADEISYDEVRTARRKGRDAFHKVIFMIYGYYANDPETRRELLEPIDAQDAQIGRWMKRRGEPPKVDPDSGEPTDEPQ